MIGGETSYEEVRDKHVEGGMTGKFVASPQDRIPAESVAVEVVVDQRPRLVDNVLSKLWHIILVGEDVEIDGHTPGAELRLDRVNYFLGKLFEVDLLMLP